MGTMRLQVRIKMESRMKMLRVTMSWDQMEVKKMGKTRWQVRMKMLQSRWTESRRDSDVI